jgi:tetratricopeptide (TPR) repeat protein
LQSHCHHSSRVNFTVSLAFFVLASTNLPAQDAGIVAANLAYSREFYSGVHFAAIATLSHTLPDKFAYDRYPDGAEERIRCDGGPYARTHPGQPWLRSDDWGRTGTPADKYVALRLEKWIKLVNAAFDPASTNFKLSDTSKMNGRIQWIFTAPAEDPKGIPIRLTFEKPTYDTNESVLLHEFVGSLHLQGDKVVPDGATDQIRFSFAYFVNIQDAELSEAAWENLQRPQETRSPSQTPESKIGLSPKDAQGYVNRGDARGKNGDLSGTIADFGRAVALDPTSVPASKWVDVYYARGMARFQRGILAAAIADYDRVNELKPNDPDLYNDRGVAKLHKTDYNGAIADFGKAIEIDPKTARNYRNRAVAENLNGDKDAALADYDKAIELDPRNANAYNKRGEIKRTKEDLTGAIADFTAAIELDPKLAQAYKNRGETKQAKGDKDGANEDLKRAEEIGSSD